MKYVDRHFANRAPSCAVLGQPLAQAVEPLRHGLTLEEGERLRSGVDLDTGDHAGLLEQLGQGRPVIGGLTDRLVEQDHAGDVVAESRCGEQELSVRSPVLLGGLDADLVEAFLYRPARLVRRQDPLAPERPALGRFRASDDPSRTPFLSFSRALLRAELLARVTPYRPSRPGLPANSEHRPAQPCPSLRGAQEDGQSTTST